MRESNKVLVAIFYRLKVLIHKVLCVTEWYFWANLLRPGNRKLWVDEIIEPKTSKKYFPESLLPYIEEVRAKQGQVRILEIGCGPLSILSWGVSQGLFALTAIDPLAEEYISILKKYGISYPVKPIKCLGEDLLKVFPRESFDIVYSQNALDHVIDVSRCMENIYGVLKDEGILFLQGFIKEASHKNWIGLHQHDLAPVNGKLIHYGRGRVTELTSGFQCLFQEQSGHRPGDWYKIIFKKILFGGKK